MNTGPNTPRPDGAPNRLASETSPYLQQHARNPVNWHPWGEEALGLARTEDKPILLSIGYSACHWCHVMERESFENDAIAALMNEHFVNIKVDREERPDLDQIYMSAVQIMTGGGGWPLTVFLTSEAKPFYGGTYFPPEDRYNRPGFPRLLIAIADAYARRRGEVNESSTTLVDQINAQARSAAAGEAIGVSLLERAVAGISERYDPDHGGFGPAPKFPSSMTIDFLLRYHHRSGEEHPLEMARVSLDKMARGGIYDHVGGGFHRYSTDAHWLVPHFEKMLYDNALLAGVYLDAYKLTRRDQYRKVVEETVDFVVRELLGDAGGFFSTLDADSEGVEGKFYVWSADEFREVAEDDSGVLARFFDVTPLGNFEGQNILHVSHEPEVFAASEGIDRGELEARISGAVPLLLERRERRVRPGRDEKILTDWNGLMLRTVARAALAFKRPDYARIAENNAEFLVDKMWDGTRLVHAFKDGQARFNGYVDDYANFADGLLALYELTFEGRWLKLALEISDRMIDEFWDSDQAAFFFTGRSHESLVARTKEYFDNATPSGNSVAADVLARLSAVADRRDLREKAEAISGGVSGHLARFPTGFGRMLTAVDYLIGPSREVAVLGDPTRFVDAVRSRYMPRTVLAGAASDPDDVVGILRGRESIDGKPTVYCCEDRVCRLPTTDPSELLAFVDQ